MIKHESHAFFGSARGPRVTRDIAQEKWKIWKKRYSFEIHGSWNTVRRERWKSERSRINHEPNDFSLCSFETQDPPKKYHINCYSLFHHFSLSLSAVATAVVPLDHDHDLQKSNIHNLPLSKYIRFWRALVSKSFADFSCNLDDFVQSSHLRLAAFAVFAIIWFEGKMEIGKAQSREQSSMSEKKKHSENKKSEHRKKRNFLIINIKKSRKRNYAQNRPTHNTSRRR